MIVTVVSSSITHYCQTPALVHNTVKLLFGAVLVTFDSMGSEVICSAVSFTAGTNESRNI